MKSDEALLLIVAEYKRATENNGTFHSAYEGYAVIAEELDELWEEVKKKAKDRDVADLRKEAMQVAAMGLRFMVDLT